MNLFWSIWSCTWMPAGLTPAANETSETTEHSRQRNMWKRATKAFQSRSCPPKLSPKVTWLIKLSYYLLAAVLYAGLVQHLTDV